MAKSKKPYVNVESMVVVLTLHSNAIAIVLRLSGFKIRDHLPKNFLFKDCTLGA
jgi:hypothetical protein